MAQANQNENVRVKPTHVVYAETEEKKALLDPAWVLRQKNHSYFLNVPEGTELPEGLDFKKFIENACFHGLVRSKENQKEALEAELQKLGINAEVNVDQRREEWYHLKYADGEQGRESTGKFVELAGRRCKIERWRSKGSPEAIQGYLKYLLVDHFSADQHLQDMVKKHRKWVPISINSGGRGGRREGLLTFNRARHYRINANDVRNFITQMGGKVSDNGDFITTPNIEEWYSQNREQTQQATAD